MSDEYEEANLDEFMLKAASILSKQNSRELGTIVDTLNQHILGIIDSKEDMKNFFEILNGVIFSTQNNESTSGNAVKIKHKDVFRIYPIIYGCNPKSTIPYLNNYFDCLNQCICEENRDDFPFLSHIFGDVIKSFYSTNTKVVLSEKNKGSLYSKFLNFCDEKIRPNEKTEQSFGCLLLTEFIENCPLVKEDESIDELFHIILNYLRERYFECKLDLLNCTISLIFTAEQKFRPYANECLFQILDYLCDSEWMKRKLAINIVYTLLNFCKDEVLKEKDNIIEFINMLKDEPVD